MDYIKQLIIIIIILVIITIIAIMIWIFIVKKKERKGITPEIYSDVNIHFNIIAWLLFANKNLKKLVTQQIIEYRHSNAAYLYDLLDSMEKKDNDFISINISACNQKYEHLKKLKKNTPYDILDIYKAIIDSLVDDCLSIKDTKKSKNCNNAVSTELQALAHDIKNSYFIQIDFSNAENNNLISESYIFSLMMSCSSYKNRIDSIYSDNRKNSHTLRVINYPSILNIFINSVNKFQKILYNEITFYGVKYQLASFVEHNYKLDKNIYSVYSKNNENWHKNSDYNCAPKKISNIDAKLKKNIHACLLIYTKV